MAIVAFFEDVISKVVNRVGRTNSVDINHTFSQHRDDLLHQELAHIQQLRVLEVLHVLPDLHEPFLLQLFQLVTFHFLGCKFMALLFSYLVVAISFFFQQVLLPFLVEFVDCW